MRIYITPDDYAQAEKNGISIKTLEHRVRQLGWPKQRAITEPPQKQMKHSEELKALALANGIPVRTYRHRIKQYGWSAERAATEPVGHPESRKAAIEAARAARGKYPKELRDRALSNGIAIDTFYCRIKRGWEPEEAATYPLLRRRP